jgi:hypothetical protein
MKRFIQPLLFALILLLSVKVNPVFSQKDSGVVEVIKDPRIDLLVKKQAQINKVAVYKNSRGEYKGYRIMIMSTNNRELAYKTRSDMLRYFPDQNVYMGYQAPYFKIKIGDFLKRPEADAFKKELSQVFDQSTYVIQDIIKVTPEQEAKLLEENAE